MKKFLCMSMLALLTFGGCEKFDPAYIESEVNDLKNRMTAIEQWATTVNSNITALQGIVATLQNADYITGVTTFASPAPGGYVISLLKGGTITISNGTAGRDGTNGTNGTDGRDGANGTDGTNGQDGASGQDGLSPQISVKQDTDGVYYWTLNGEWIIAGGNKLRVTGEKGATGSAGQDGATPQLRVDPGTNTWEVSYNEGGTWISLGVKATGNNGQDGATPQLRVNSGTNFWEVSYNGGSAWTSLGVEATGNAGQNGTTPQLRINSGTNMWEVSYNEGGTWISLGVKATGNNEQDGIVPQLRVNTGTNFWEVSYNGGDAWTSLGVKATGANGSAGQDGITPQIRINAGSNEWEISYSNGVQWESTGIKATGAKGETGAAGNADDAIFAADGVDYSSPEHVVFTLVDGMTIKVPKYKKLGLNFTQPGAFAADETKTVAYTPEGDVVIIKFLDIPAGWKASVDYSALAFTITAPATFDSDNSGGEAILLISDNDQNVITRTINLVANDGDDGGDDGGGDDGGDGTAGHIEIDGYSGNTLTIYYTNGTNSAITQSADNSFAVPANHKIIESIVLEGGTTIIAGREADGSVISFKIAGGSLVFRAAVEGYIPIGTYAEFQLINMISTARNGSYKQDADLDLFELEWTPVGTSSSSAFSGKFDGDNHTIANLKISISGDSQGLFGHNRGTVSNVHVISGSVSGRNSVGGVCGYNSGSISQCSNACLVSGSSDVGGVCGYSRSITACHNTGAVSGSGNNIGGVCGYSYSSITTCYNTGPVSGSSNVGGVCGSCSSVAYSPSSSSSSIAACYNTGPVSGSSNVGGVCGYSNSSSSNNDYSSSTITAASITACYNTGSVSGSGNYVGGVCGYSNSSSPSDDSSSSSSIRVCYNTGSVSGNSDVGGVCGYFFFLLLLLLLIILILFLLLPL
jgi:hypothetical protein